MPDIEAELLGWTTSCADVCPSPLLVAGKLIVFGPKEKVKADSYVLKAYDPASGKLVWCADTQIANGICGTPVPLRLSNGKDTMDVIVTANGTVVRADDGKILCPYIGAREFYGSPTAANNLFTISEAGAKSLFELFLIDRDTVGVRRRWYVKHPGVFQDGNYGVFSNGKLYFSRPLLDVTDVVSGNLEWLSGNVFFCRPGRGYPPIALAGNRIYCADNATWFQPTYRPGLRPFPGAMPVVEIGEPPLPLACNLIDRISGGFTFDDDRLYIRGFRALMCIGYTGDEGRAWEAAKVAANLIRSELYDAPCATPPVQAKALVAVGDRKLAVGSGAVGVVGAWAFTSLPAGSAADVAKALSDSAWSGWFEGGKQEVTVGGQAVPMKLLNGRNMPHWAFEDPFKLFGRKNRDGGDLFWTGVHIGYGEMLGRQVELTRLVKPESGNVAILATLLVNDVRCMARFDAGNVQVVGAWIGGVEVKHNQYVELPAGGIPLVVSIGLDDPGEPIIAQPRLWPSNGREADHEHWLSILRRARPYFENAARRAPKTYAGRRAAALLASAP